MGSLFDRSGTGDGTARRRVTRADPNDNAHPNTAAWIWLLGVIIVGAATDLLSKWLAFEHVADVPVRITRQDVLNAEQLGSLVPRHDPVTVLPGLLDFTLVLNPGAVFGIGAGRRVVFIGFTVAAIAFALWMFRSWTRSRDRWAHTGIGLLIAGGIGNLYDRMAFACVRDFIHPLPGMKLPFGSWPNGSDEVWPYVSNIADLWLIVGIAILLIVSWIRPAPKAAIEDAGAPTPEGEAKAST